MASSTNGNGASVKKAVVPTNNPAAPPQQFFRRERSFVVQRPAQQQASGQFMQRERSFIRDNNRSSGNFSNGNFSTGNAQANSNSGGKPRNAGNQTNSGKWKPNMEIYRPPGVRAGDGPAINPGSGRIQQPRLTKSRTSLDLNSSAAKNAQLRTQQVTFVAQPAKQDSAAADNSTDNAPFALQRSKSSGSHLSLQQQKVPVASPVRNVSPSELPDVGAFPEQVQTLLRKIAVDPDGAGSRLIMDAVRTLFGKIIESSRYASVISRYCYYVIEKETKGTFLESLLNTCQESFQERDRLLRSPGGSSQRWVAFINFLNEMYLQMKRKNWASRAKSGNTRLSPDLIILNILAESCCVTLKQPSAHSLQELECLFFVLTGVGRDIETELPGKMAAIWNAIRDTFLEMNSLPGAAQRTLLQLVELRAAKWQLPATAVTYYYPSVSGSAY